MLYLTLSAILSAGRADVFPWWGIGYGLLALHHIVRVYEVGRIPLKNSFIITIVLYFRCATWVLWFLPRLSAP